MSFVSDEFKVQNPWGLEVVYQSCHLGSSLKVHSTACWYWMRCTCPVGKLLKKTLGPKLTLWHLAEPLRSPWS